MAKQFRCTIVTPSESVFDDEVSYVSLPAWDGQLGMMVGQSPLVTRLGVGSLRLEEPSGSKQKFWIDGGFAQMNASVLTVLTERALAPDTLTAQQAETELAEANALAVSGGGTTPEDREKVERAQTRARTKRAMARVSGDR